MSLTERWISGFSSDSFTAGISQKGHYILDIFGFSDFGCDSAAFLEHGVSVVSGQRICAGFSAVFLLGAVGRQLQFDLFITAFQV